MKMYSDNNNAFVGFFDDPFWQAPKLGGIICKTNLIASAVVTTTITTMIVIINNNTHRNNHKRELQDCQKYLLVCDCYASWLV